MKKTMLIMLCIIITNVAWSQELFVGASGSMTITPEAYVYSVGDVTANGDLAVWSDATDSGSLITTGTTAGSKFAYKRYVTGANDAGTIGTTWHLVSAPVGEQNIAAFGADSANEVSVNSPKYAVAWYNNQLTPATKWVYIETGGAETFTRGQGYSTHRQTSGVYNFEGPMDDATVTFPMTTGAGSYPDHTWFCVGNPYPSFLSTQAVFDDNTAVLDATDNGLYIWEASEYKIRNNASITAGEQLPPGQAFLVKALTASQTFTFNEASQAPQASGSTAVINRSASTVTPKIVVSLFNGSATKTTELKYFSNTTTGLDVGWDAGAFRTGGTVGFSIETHLVADSQGRDITLQCLPDFDYDQYTIPLAVYAAVGQNITFNATAENLPAGLHVYLEDRKNNTVTKINETAYTITLAESQAGIGRFYLYTADRVLSVEDIATVSGVSIYKTVNTNIRIAGLQEGAASLKMYNIAGKEVFASNFTAQAVKDITIPSLSAGVYLVQVVAQSGKHTKKLIIE